MSQDRVQTGPMHDGQADDYLARIGARKPDRPDAAALAELTRRHLATVPFENLSIHLGDPIALDEDAFLDKLVTRRRSGYYEAQRGVRRPAGAARVRRRVARRAGVRARRRSWDRHACRYLALRVDLAEDREGDPGERGWSTSSSSPGFVAERSASTGAMTRRTARAPSGWSRPATATSTSCWTGPRSTAWTAAAGASTSSRRPAGSSRPTRRRTSPRPWCARCPRTTGGSPSASGCWSPPG